MDQDLAAQVRPACIARTDGESGGARSTGSFARDHHLLRVRVKLGSVLDGPPERGQFVVIISRARARDGECDGSSGRAGAGKADRSPRLP